MTFAVVELAEVTPAHLRTPTDATGQPCRVFLPSRIKTTGPSVSGQHTFP